MTRKYYVAIAAFVAALVTIGCGSGSPTAPSTTTSVTTSVVTPPVVAHTVSVAGLAPSTQTFLLQMGTITEPKPGLGVFATGFDPAETKKAVDYWNGLDPAYGYVVAGSADAADFKMDIGQVDLAGVDVCGTVVGMNINGGLAIGGSARFLFGLKDACLPNLANAVAVAHEMGHLMGFPHTPTINGLNDTMGVNASAVLRTFDDLQTAVTWLRQQVNAGHLGWGIVP